jgi:hypothetical protein
MLRQVLPEILDHLPADDPEAIGRGASSETARDLKLRFGAESEIKPVRTRPGTLPRSFLKRREDER